MASPLDLGSQFQALRKAQGLTQQTVATSAGMRQEALSRFERGRTDLSLGKLLRLLHVLNLELEIKPRAQRPTLDAVLRERRSQRNVGPASR